MNIASVVKKVRNIKFLRSFSVYVFATFFNRGASFLLLPFFTYYLSTADFGILSLITTTISVMTILIMVGTDGALRRQYYALTPDRFRIFFSSSVIGSISAFLILLLITIVTAPWISKWLNIPFKFLVFAVVISFLSIFPKILQGQNRVQKKPRAFALFTNSMTISDLLLGLFFVAVFHLGYQGRVYSLIIVNLLFTFIAIYLLKKQDLFTRDISKSDIRFSLAYGLPSIPHLLSGMVMNYSDRIFIARIRDVNELGVYNVGYTIGMTISILMEAFILAYVPFLFENLKEGKRYNHIKIVRTTYIFIIFLFASFLGLLVISPFIFKYIIDQKFAGGLEYVFWIGLGAVFLGLYKIFSGFIFYHNKTKYFAYLGIFNIILNLILNYILVTWCGAKGAAYSTAITFFVLFFVTFVIGTRLQNMPWFDKKIFQFRKKITTPG